MSTAQIKPGNLQPLQNNSTNQQPLEIYHLSHDLRGPLNSILGFTELLYEGIEGPVNDIQMEDLAAIKQSAQNLLRLINTIVDLSKVDSERLTFNVDSVPLSYIVQQIVDSEPALTSTTEITLDLPSTLPPAKGDTERVQQIIYTILDFAQARKRTTQISISAKADNTNIMLNIVVSGLTFPAELTATLFDLKVTVDAAGRSELGVGGLTLPLAKQLAERQHGQLGASNTNNGIEFTLTLPRYTVEDS